MNDFIERTIFTKQSLTEKTNKVEKNNNFENERKKTFLNE